jgi:hypothetical protein
VSEDTLDSSTTLPLRKLPDGSSQIAPTERNAKVRAPEISATNRSDDSPWLGRINAEISTSGPKKPFYSPDPIVISQPILRFDPPKPTHETSFGLAYVNEIGRTGFTRKPFVFPTGALIVREKLPALNANPERLVVMIKHERSFNPKANGWEFLTLSGDGAKVLNRQKNGQCLRCHLSASNNDFVFPEDGRYR